MRHEAANSNALDDIAVEQSQTNLDIMSIIKKYGGVSTDTSWVNELNVLEKKNERKNSYLDSQRDSESVASSI